MSSAIASVGDIFSTVFLVMNAKSIDKASVLLISASPRLQQEISGYRLVSPGVHRGVWTIEQAKHTARCFRDLGYVVLVYKYKFVAEWFTPISSLVEATGYEDFDAPTAPSIDFDLAEIGKVLPERSTYVELCGGGAPLFMSRSPVPVEVYNDCDHHVVNLFDQLRDPRSFQWFFLLSRLFTINSYLHPILLRKLLRQVDKEDAVIIAYLWYCYLRQVCILSKDAGPSVSFVEGTTFDALSVIDTIFPEIHGRLFRMQHENNSWEKILDIYDSENTMFWVDPSEYGMNAVHVGSKSEDTNFDVLLSKLNAVKGVVALYFNHNDLHHGFTKRSEFLADPDNKWITRNFKSSTVFLKNADFKED